MHACSRLALGHRRISLDPLPPPRRNAVKTISDPHGMSNSSKPPTIFSGSAKSTSCSSIAPNITWKACSRLLKMVTFHCLRSCCENPLVCINRICFRTVDFPDSPAPGGHCQHCMYELAKREFVVRERSICTQQQHFHLSGRPLLILRQLLLNLFVLPRIGVIFPTASKTHDSVEAHPTEREFAVSARPPYSPMPKDEMRS